MENSQAVANYRKIVYLIVRQIPAGCVSTYGQIAEMIPAPAGIDPPHYHRVRAQWVGRAMRHAPEDLPWQRVINSQGKISMPAGSRGAAIQRMRLEAEGVAFDRHSRVDLDRFGWQGPDLDWIAEHKLLPARPLGEPSSGQLSLF
jgi:methylated-DNA-protein-cysteine methyltransferase-like protein